MGILSRLLHHGNQDTTRIDAMVERIMTLHPHLRLARRYRASLAPVVETALHYLDDLVASVSATREASAAA